MVLGTGIEFLVLKYFRYQFDSHFLSFSVPVLYYLFDVVPVSYRTFLVPTPIFGAFW
ncbi:hypothetical protein HanOQP8_Chr02g0046321 [Helianthus annuus]|nr:hypothetical protein HanOQP8_Chr02g0046321 [Helianthus annuus]